MDKTLVRPNISLIEALETLPLTQIKTIGVALNKAHGFTCISIINPKSGKTKNTFLN